MIAAMPKTATQNPVKGATDLRLHVSQSSISEKSKVIDFTEKKLQRILGDLYSPEKRAQVLELIEKYLSGKVAVGWNSGRPIYVDIIRDR